MISLVKVTKITYEFIDKIIVIDNYIDSKYVKF